MSDVVVARRRTAPSRRSPALLPRGWAPISSLEFPGCRRVPMTYGEFLRTDRRVEVWDAESETGLEAREGPSAPHERGSGRLRDLIGRIDRARGASCGFMGSTGIRLRHPFTGAPRMVSPDESVYVDRKRADGIGTGGSSHWIEEGEGEKPDVVLEVDHTTNSRQSKLYLYEAWGAPEVWIEVPDEHVYSRPAGLRPGLGIFLLGGGRYRESKVSLAFPGWRAEEIHRGLNERRTSAATLEVLERVGRALAERDRTSPLDDPQTKSAHEDGWAEGREQGRAEGHAEGHAEGMVTVWLGSLRSLLEERGIAPDPGFRERLSRADRAFIAAAHPATVLGAARAAANEDDFLCRLRRADGASRRP